MITILKMFRIHNVITEIFDAASQYLDGFMESNSRNCDIILAVTVASNDSFT